MVGNPDERTENAADEAEKQVRYFVPTREALDRVAAVLGESDDLLRCYRHLFDIPASQQRNAVRVAVAAMIIEALYGTLYVLSCQYPAFFAAPPWYASQPRRASILALSMGAMVVFMRVCPVLKSLPMMGVPVFSASSIMAGTSTERLGAPLP